MENQRTVRVQIRQLPLPLSAFEYFKLFHRTARVKRSTYRGITACSRRVRIFKSSLD